MGLTYSKKDVILKPMKRRDIVIGIVILALLAGVTYWRRNRASEEALVVSETLSVEDQIEQRFNLEIPEDVDRAELTDTTGGNASALATKKFEAGSFSHSVLADLPDPTTGTFYQGWISKGEEGSEDFKLVSTGRLSIAKGGWMLDFSSKTDYSEYSKVMITEEKVNDSTPEKTILEGNF